MNEYFPEPKFSGERVEFELDFSDYATKADFENETGVDTSKFAEKLHVASLKFDIDKLDIDKLEKVPTGLNSLKNKVDKLYVDKLVLLIINVIINEIENKIPNLTNLATTNTLTGAKNKTPNHSKYITTPEFNKSTAENFTARLKQANLAIKA